MCAKNIKMKEEKEQNVQSSYIFNVSAIIGLFAKQITIQIKGEKQLVYQ